MNVRWSWENFWYRKKLEWERLDIPTPRAYLRDLFGIECFAERHFGIFQKWNRIETTSDYTVFQCPRCKEIQKVTWSHTTIEWVPKKIKEDRQKYAKSLLQPYRAGIPSKEYIDSYGTSRFSPADVAKAKPVWKDILPSNWEKSK